MVDHRQSHKLPAIVASGMTLLGTIWQQPKINVLLVQSDRVILCLEIYRKKIIRWGAAIKMFITILHITVEN